jgi:hypothetical protein
MSRKELERLKATPFAFAHENVREMDFSSKGRAARLADCEGDKSATGEVQLSMEQMTLANAVAGDIEQGDAFDYEGNAPDPDSSAGRIVTWECDQCERIFEVDIDERPDCCPDCESTNIRERSRERDVPNEEPSAEDDESEIPAVLVDAARFDGNLEELRNVHKTNSLQDEDAASTDSDKF